MTIKPRGLLLPVLASISAILPGCGDPAPPPAPPSIPAVAPGKVDPGPPTAIPPAQK